MYFLIYVINLLFQFEVNNFSISNQFNRLLAENKMKYANNYRLHFLKFLQPKYKLCIAISCVNFV